MTGQRDLMRHSLRTKLRHLQKRVGVSPAKHSDNHLSTMRCWNWTRSDGRQLFWISSQHTLVRLDLTATEPGT